MSRWLWLYGIGTAAPVGAQMVALREVDEAMIANRAFLVRRCDEQRFDARGRRWRQGRARGGCSAMSARCRPSTSSRSAPNGSARRRGRREARMGIPRTLLTLPFSLPVGGIGRVANRVAQAAMAEAAGPMGAVVSAAHCAAALAMTRGDAP